MADFTDRLTGTDCDLRILKDVKAAKETCTQGNTSIYENIPHPKSYIIDGHICVRLKDILKQSLALGVEK